MTTTELYSGYSQDGKPTSRVLRPPGGGSSNIFGDPEPTPQQRVRQEQQQANQNAQSEPQQRGAQPSNPTQEAKEQYLKNKPKGRVQYNPITGEEYPADYQQHSEADAQEEQKDDNKDEDSDKEKTNSETTTPEAESKPEPQATEANTPPKPKTTSVKVRQPPGGKSSGPLW